MIVTCCRVLDNLFLNISLRNLARVRNVSIFFKYQITRISLSTRNDADELTEHLSNFAALLHDDITSYFFFFLL